jgi:DNA-binding FadR family transcriptional regulator
MLCPKGRVGSSPTSGTIDLGRDRPRRVSVAPADARAQRKARVPSRKAPALCPTPDWIRTSPAAQTKSRAVGDSAVACKGTTKLSLGNIICFDGYCQAIAADNVAPNTKGPRVSDQQPNAGARRGRPRGGSRLTVDVAADVVDRIVRGVLPPGSTLPNEAGLCEYYDVSRPVIREALKVVEQKRLIRIRRGDGTTVLPKEEWMLLDADVLRISLELDEAGTLRRDVIALRRDLEMSMAARSVGHLTPADFEEIERLLDEMDASPDSLVVDAIDYEVHRRIHRASGNDVARNIAFLLVDEVRRVYPAKYPREDYDESNRSLRRVIVQLKAGNAEAAAQAMADHISANWFFSKETFLAD